MNTNLNLAVWAYFYRSCVVVVIWLWAPGMLFSSDVDYAAGTIDTTAEKKIRSFTLTSEQTGGSRVALVIGNAHYQHMPPLVKTIADANSFSKLLRKRGFEVIQRTDSTRRQMNEAVSEFVNKLSSNTVGIVYYSGHGVQIAGQNYLLPVDLVAEREQHVVDDAIGLDVVLERMAQRETKFSLAVIDACRNNPLKSPVSGRAIGVTKGLAPVAANVKGMMILFAAGAGQEAVDSIAGDDSPNGLFTGELVKAMQEPGLSVIEVMIKAKQAVIAKAAAIGREQIPSLYDQSVGTFVFTPSERTVTADDYQDDVKTQVVNAQYENGERYYQSGNYTEAARWFRKSAQQGHALGQHNLGVMYAKGLGVKRSYAEAVKWYRKAAEQEHPESQINLGLMYSRGLGVKRNYAAAVEWYLKAVERGDAGGHNNLGAMYEQGQGIAKNYVEAAKHYSQAASKGYDWGQYNIGRMYEYGLGVPKDLKTALVWYRKAANQGNVEAIKKMKFLSE